MTFDIAASAELQQNRVHFVTFNYDMSLDNYLLSSLGSIELLKQEHIAEFMGEDRVLHVYGKLQLPSSGAVFPIHKGAEYRDVTVFNEAKMALDQIYKASEPIRVINPHDKALEGKTIERAQQLLAEAKVVYILGFGFDRLNSELLKLPDLLLHPLNNRKAVLWTNMNDSLRVTVEASRILTGQARELVDARAIPGAPGREIWSLKSVRNVYDAFAYDFHAPEQLERVR